MVTGSASQSAPAEQLTAMQKERIAIIGVGCRLPGGVTSKDSLWKLLVEGREGVVQVAPDRWNVERYYDAEPGVAGKSIALRGGFIDAIDQFDPQFFGISPREAPYVDPQHRLLLETAWEAIEDAGLVLDFERGTDLGVFVGISHNDYQGVQGVILGTSINQDGHTNGIMLPSPEAQTRLVQDACRDAGIAPEEIGFVEAHGTGTAVGDPIEAHALAEALCGNRSADAPLPIGSIKTNLGHLETAAGIAGLLKAMLVLKHGQIPPSLHFSTPNPHIDFEKLKLRVPTQLEPFPNGTEERIAGVNSFGFGGANAHVILAEPPPHQPEKSLAIPSCRPWPLVLSARSEASLRTSAANLSAWVKEHANANGSSPVLPDLTYTLGARRNHHPYRLTLVADSWAELSEELDTFAKKEESQKVRAAFTARREQPPRIAFTLTGP